MSDGVSLGAWKGSLAAGLGAGELSMVPLDRSCSAMLEVDVLILFSYDQLSQLPIIRLV